MNLCAYLNKHFVYRTPRAKEIKLLVVVLDLLPVALDIMANKVQILKLYKDLLKEASSFRSYYYKNYFIRKVETQFKQPLEDGQAPEEFVTKSEDMLAMLKRQTMVDNAYNTSSLVIEKDTNNNNNNKTAD